MTTYPKMSIAAPRLAGASCGTGEIKPVWFRVVGRVCWCQADYVSNGAVCKEFVVGTKGGIRDCPLPHIIIDSLLQ